jgi:hypothetical protein
MIMAGTQADLEMMAVLADQEKKTVVVTGGSPYVTVNINGHQMRVVTDEPTEVPQGVYEVLMSSGFGVQEVKPSKAKKRK